MWTSKTFWLGIGTIGTAVVSTLVNGGGWHEAVMAGVGAAMIVFRQSTQRKINAAGGKR